MNYRSGHFIKRIQNLDPNKLFLFLLTVFFIDSAVNFFIHLPVFVPVSLIVLPLLWVALWKSHRKNIFLLAFVSFFILVTVINNFVFTFDKKNLSDLAFILFFPVSYYFYKLKPEKLHARTIHIFFGVILLMLVFTFTGVNSKSFYRASETWRVELKQLLSEKNGEQSEEMVIKRKNKPLDVLESQRSYHYGLFRVPHLASYFLFFVALFYADSFGRKKNRLFLIAAILSVLLLIYTGTRTILVAAVIAMLLFLIRRKTLVYFFIAGALLAVSIYFRYQILELTKNTFLEQFATLQITAVDNFDRFSRVTIWRSWWHEFRQFTWYEMLIGKTFYASKVTNLVNIHYKEWFHNDFLSIAYSYGIPALLLYCAFLYRIFRENARYIRRNIYLFLFFFTMVFAALFNGFYYYFPVFLMFIFIHLLRAEKKKKRL